MGYGKVYNVGAFKDWAESGGAIEKPRACDFRGTMLADRSRQLHK